MALHIIQAPTRGFSLMCAGPAILCLDSPALRHITFSFPGDTTSGIINAAEPARWDWTADVLRNLQSLQRVSVSYREESVTEESLEICRRVLSRLTQGVIVSIEPISLCASST